MNRRFFLRSALTVLAAPAIVRASSLMSVHSLPPEFREVMRITADNGVLLNTRVIATGVWIREKEWSGLLKFSTVFHRPDLSDVAGEYREAILRSRPELAPPMGLATEDRA